MSAQQTPQGHSTLERASRILLAAPFSPLSSLLRADAAFLLDLGIEDARTRRDALVAALKEAEAYCPVAVQDRIRAALATARGEVPA